MKRLVFSLVLVVMVSMVLSSSALAINARVHYVKFFSQRNPAWADDRMGSGCLMKNSGCVVTCVVMVMDYMYCYTTPKVFNNWLNRHGGYSGCNLRWSTINQFSGGKTYFYQSLRPSWSRLQDEIKRGYPVMVKVLLNGHGHWVLVRGWERVNGRDIYYINDPWDRSFSVKTLASYGNKIYRMVTFRTKYFPSHSNMHSDCIRRNGGSRNVGQPINNYHWWRHAWVRDYSGGRYGWDIIMYYWNSYYCGVPKADLLRTGFFKKYRAIGGPYSALGYPLDEEYPSFHYGKRARQDFTGGYMVWYGSYAKVFDWSGRRIYRSLDVVTKDEALASIIQISPNPALEATTIRFYLREPQQISLKVFNVKGRLVKVLVNGFCPTGEQEVVWDARNLQGQKVSSGIYFIRLQAGTYQQTKKMVLR